MGEKNAKLVIRLESEMTSSTSGQSGDNVVMFRAKRARCDGGAGTRFGRENEPRIYVKQYN